MQAIILDAFGGRDQLRLADVPQPQPADGEVLIRVKAAGVNPVDWKIREGYLEGRLPHAMPIIPGWDVAGIVEATNGDSAGLAVGDAVYAYARKPVIQHGCYAEYVTFEAAHVAPKPPSLSFEEAASIPLAALTAYQSLFDAANLQAGEKLLVHAAAGGVGSFAVQLARHAGAEIWGTASPGNHDYLRELGVDHPIDYHTEDFRTVAAGMDVIYDCVGGETLDQSPAALAPNGRLVTIVDGEKCEALVQQGINAQWVFVSPNGAQLRTLAELVEAGALKTHLAATLPLAEAAEAQELIETQHTCGKIVLHVP
jgi:NADPH:quinone reductase-like Zn-dependent oxidoreductase